MKIQKEFAAIRVDIAGLKGACDGLVDAIQQLQKRVKLLETPKKNAKPKRKTTKP